MTHPKDRATFLSMISAFAPEFRGNIYEFRPIPQTISAHLLLTAEIRFSTAFATRQHLQLARTGNDFLFPFGLDSPARLNRRLKRRTHACVPRAGCSMETVS